MKILVLGGSYTGKYIHNHFSEHIVFFMSRSPADLVSQGYRPWDGAFSWDEPFDMILDTVPALLSEKGEIELPYRYPITKILAAFPETAYVHVSSTSVYPQGIEAGEISELPVYDEKTPPAPENKQGEKRLLLEKNIKAYFSRAKIIRSGGIYGPGRGMAFKIKSGSFPGSDENRMISRIHVHDLSRICLAAAFSDLDLVNAVDLHPSPNSETYAYLEDCYGKKIPGNWKDRPVSGRILKSLYAEKLLGEFKYPSYKEGFAK